MTDPQVWTLIAVFGAAFIGILGLSTRHIVNTMDARFGALDARLTAEVSRLDAKIDGRADALDAKIDGRADTLDAKIGRLDAKIDGRADTLDAKINDRFDRLSEVMGVRFDAVEHRLGAVEDDMKLIKAHLLKHPAA